jgi:hypothetical protein
MFSTGPAVSMRLAPAIEIAWHPALVCFGWAQTRVGHAKHIALCRFAQIWTTRANPRPALVKRESTNEYQRRQAPPRHHASNLSAAPSSRIEYE